MRNINIEDHLPLAEVVKTNFAIHKAEISKRFPKCDDDFLARFEAKIAEVKALESPYEKLQDQKSVTRSLYDNAQRINKELNFLTAYLKGAKCDTKGISAIKIHIAANNLEGAIQGLRELVPYLVTHRAVLIAEGMSDGFPEELHGWTEELHQKNTLQNTKMDERKELHAKNRKLYEEMNEFVSIVADNGKRVFDKTVIADEFNISKIIGRMNR